VALFFGDSIAVIFDKVNRSQQIFKVADPEGIFGSLEFTPFGTIEFRGLLHTHGLITLAEVKFQQGLVLGGVERDDSDARLVGPFASNEELGDGRRSMDAVVR